MTNNVFLKEPEQYQRDIDPVRQYVEQTSFFISKMTGKDLMEARSIVEARSKTNAVNPTVTFFHRDETKDKHVEEIGLKQYIGDVVANGELLAPTFTSYIQPSQEESVLVGFVERNVAGRSKAKKAAFKAKSEGDMDTFITKNNEQGNLKLYNNSMSGAFGSDSSILFNQTAHSTLTSTVRTMSSLSNANNEKLIEGNRHYYSFEVTLNNLITLASDVSPVLKSCIEKHGLIYPSVGDTLTCIKRSTNLYWSDRTQFATIETFIGKLTPLERASVVYTSDLYHIRQLNEEMVRGFLSKLSKRCSKDSTEMLDYLGSVSDELIALAHSICMSDVRGKGLDHKSMDVETIRLVYGTIVNINETLQEYKTFIEAIFLTNHIPNNTASIKSMVRRAVVLSDTDSTLFSVDSWVKWYFGKIVFTDESYAISGAVGFLATQTIAHILANFSANINVDKSKLSVLAMKPEYCFNVFAQALVSKHYFTFISVQEGNVWEKGMMEIKGATLKSSASPKYIVDAIHARMEHIVKTVMAGELVSINDEIKFVTDLETRIEDSLLSGSPEYLKMSKIKTFEAYAADDVGKTPFAHHLMWENVFSDKYGAIEPPPYNCVKVPTTLTNATKLKAWLENMEDKDVQRKMSLWLKTHKKTTLPTMYVSTSYVNSFGVPKEITDVMNTTKTILDVTKAARMTLEVLGYFTKNDQPVKDQI